MNRQPSLQYFKKATPRQQGYMAYTFSHWANSRIPEKNPYKHGSKKYKEFESGVFSAVLSAQDGEG